MKRILIHFLAGLFLLYAAGNISAVDANSGSADAGVKKEEKKKDDQQKDNKESKDSKKKSDTKKKYDTFQDKNNNGIDDRKENLKKKTTDKTDKKDKKKKDNP